MRISVAYLRLLTLAYIAFPLLPFLGGWVRLEVAVPAILLLGYGCFVYGKELDYSKSFRISRKALIASVLLFVFWLLVSGAGGMGYQHHDHVKNNTLTKELSQLAWPLSYDVDGEKMYLSHYLGYYLPGPAVVGFLGYKYAQLFNFVWAFLGMGLGVFWLGRYVKQWKWYFVLVMIVFGGLPVFAFIFKFGGAFLEEIVRRSNEHGYVFWMNCWDIIPLNYMSLNDMLQWTPQHVIPALLGIGVMANDAFVDKDIRYTPFIISLLAFWSPLILVGLFPYFLYVLLHQRLHGILNHINFIIAPLLFGLVATYLLAIESGDLVKHFIFTDLSEYNISLGQQIGAFLYFLVFEVLVWAIPLFLIARKMENRRLFYFTVILLLFIPLYRFGLWNDWSNRVSMPAIIVLFLFVYEALVNTSKKLKVVLVILLMFSSVGPLMNIIGSLKYTNFRPAFVPPAEHVVQDLPTICVSYPITQFVAKEETFFFKYLAKKPRK